MPLFCTHLFLFFSIVYPKSRFTLRYLYLFLITPSLKLDCYVSYTERRASTGSSIFYPSHHQHRRPSRRSTGVSTNNTTSDSQSIKPTYDYIQMTATSIEQQEHINDNDNQQQQRGIRILLVDDNFVNLQVLSRVLRMHMASIIQHIELAKSGIQALELLCHHAYDLVLLDIDMPVLSGLDTARQIRTSSDILAENRVIPIVAVTTNDTADWKRLFVQCGMVRSFTLHTYDVLFQ